MEGRGGDDPVTLTLRAADQKIQDQKISCSLHWTVEKLRRYISITYPLSREQRLVYSGCLLQDHQQLRDILREQDEYHVLHLVCAPSVSSEFSLRNTDAAGPALSAPSANQGSAPHSSGSSIRWRPAPAPWAAGATPLYTPVQMLWWQRMYTQHYYMQYRAAAVAASQTSPPAARPRPTDAPPAPGPAPHIPRVNELNRDWLDWTYAVVRAAVLLGAVYFYSSFSRFVMVTGAVLLFYLHQAGWFPFRPELQNQRNNDMQEMERMMDDGVEEDEDDDDDDDDGPEEAPSPPQPSFLSSTWSFIFTFFTSLVPEGPPRPAR